MVFIAPNVTHMRLQSVSHKCALLILVQSKVIHYLHSMPVIDHDALISPDDNLTIWRYMDLSKFESLLRDQALFFCRSDKFSDPFEGSVPRKESEGRIREQKRTSLFHFKKKISDKEALKSSRSIGDLHRRFRRSLVVNCWHINDGESDAMWRLYLKTNEGVAIQSSVERLRQSFERNEEEVFISKVRYLDFENDIWHHETEYPVTSYNLFSPIIHKRNAFEHEREIRIFQQINDAVDNDEFWGNMPNQVGKSVVCDIDALFDKVILPPTADDLVASRVRSTLENYGLDKPLEKSKLNEEPYY